MEGRMEGWTDKWTLFNRTLPAEARGPKQLFHQHSGQTKSVSSHDHSSQTSEKSVRNISPSFEIETGYL